MHRKTPDSLLLLALTVAAVVGIFVTPGGANLQDQQTGESPSLATGRRARSLLSGTQDQHKQQQPQDLGLFQRPRSPVFNVPPGDELTMRQLYSCLAELVVACQSGGFADLLKVDTAGRSPRDWQAEPQLLEQLRVMLFRAHRQDRPEERLALCFIIKTPDIFDQSRPRQDPVCLHLARGQFRMETDILRAQKTLCRSGNESPAVHYLCSRPVTVTKTTATTAMSAAAVDVTSAPSSASTSAQESALQHRRASSKSTTKRRSGVFGSSGEAEEKLKCALVWIVGVLLALIIVLVAGILAHTLLHRQSYALAPAPQCFANDKTSLMEESGRCIAGSGGGGGGGGSPGPARHSECVL